MRRGRTVAGGSAALAALSLLTAPAAAAPDGEQVLGLVVTREAGTSAAEATAAIRDVVGAVESRTAVAPGVTAVTVAGLTRPEAQAAADELAERDGIAEVGLDTRARPALTPDDPQYPQQWALTDTLSGIRAADGWDSTHGDGAVIAVIDSGIVAHEDLEGQLLPGYDFVSDPVVANDGDSRDSDPADPGDWVEAADVSAHPELFESCPREPSSWHGTHVAGLAAAVQNNAVGISGVAPDARVLPIRALGKCGGAMSDIVAAITWASGGAVPGVPENPTPADVVNLSLSSRITCQPYVQAAIDDAIGRGAVVVAAAGNATADFTRSSPGGCYDVLAVGGADRAGNRATYSNFGTGSREAPLFAPGGEKAEGLLSTVNPGTKQPVPGSAYATYAGTSMATPLVAGTVALLAASRPDLPPAALAGQVRVTARPFPAGSNCTGACGAGLLDTGRALGQPMRVPGAVRDLQVRAGDGSLSLQWTAPDDPGTGPVTGYRVEIRPVGGSWAAADSVWSSTLGRKVVVGLNNGVAYDARVAARSDFGSGPWVQSSAVTPVGLPGPVRVRSVRYPSPTAVLVRLKLPVDPLLAVQYRLVSEAVPDPLWQDRPVTDRLRIALPRGIRYILQVRAVNQTGASAAVRRMVATPVKPGAVRSLRATLRGRMVTIRWQEPVRTGLRPTYRVRVGDAPWRKTSTTRIRLRGVEPGPLRVQVQSANEAGRGPVRSLTKRK